MGRPLISTVLSEAELKKLRAKPFLERNQIIQDALNKKMNAQAKARRERERKELQNLRANRKRNTDKNFAF